VPYTKAHKERTRGRILDSARSLFSEHGFDAVTVDQVMSDCGLTRGAFYAHFKSKGELYTEALRFSALSSELAKKKPVEVSPRDWVSQLLDAYLSVEHVSGKKPCPLAFMVTDVASKDPTTRAAYTDAYRNMNKVILAYVGTEYATREDVLALSAMMIGAVAVSRTMDDERLVKRILAASREQAREILDGV